MIGGENMHSIINQISSSSPTSSISNVKQEPQKPSVNFADLLKASIEQVNHAEKVTDVKTEALAKGEIEDLHDVMITAQKAAITIETTVEVQKKMIDAYNEIMRMQV